MYKTFLKEKMYESMELDNRKRKKLKEDRADRKLFKEFKILVDGRVYEVSHTPQRRDEIFKILQQAYPGSEIEVVPYNHYESGAARKELERIINKQLQEYGVNESLKEDYNSDLEEERKIQKYLNDNQLWGEVEVNDGTVYVEINWGDWKHEHLRCRYLMNDLGYQQDYVDVTEEDGSDCYSAIHTYIKKDMNESLTESLNGVDKVAQASQNIVQKNRNTWLPIYYDIKNKTVLTEDDYKKSKDKTHMFKVTELIKPNTAEEIERAVNRALSM